MLLCCGGLTAALGSCSRPEAPRTTRGVALSPRVNSPDEVVARVNKVPILRHEVEQQLQAGQTPRQALEALIQRELLAQEAARRGLAAHTDVRRAQRRTLANLLLRQEIGASFTKKDVPQELLRRAYDLNKGRFVRPELRRAAHVLVKADSSNTRDFHRRARKVAQEARSIAAAGQLTEEEFKQIAGMMTKQHPTITTIAQTGTTARKGVTVEPFARATFALERVGQVSPVVQTQHGYHVIYLVSIQPSKNVSFEQADAELRDRVFKQAREQAFRLWADELERKHKARLVSKGERS